jgi:hypothetical protein
MDKNKLKEFITSVAEVEELKPVTMGDKPPDEATEVFWQGEWIEVDRHINPTLGFKFIRLKEINRTCALDCGNIVTDQIIEKRHCLTPKPHWRTRCNICGKFLSPDGKELIAGGHAIQSAYIKYFNIKNIRVKSKPIITLPTSEAINMETDEYIQIVTNEGVIRHYK